MVIAEQGLLPSAETMKSHRNGNGHVNPDHTRLDTLHERPRRIAFPGEYRDAITENVRIDQVHRLVERTHANHHQDRPKDLLLVDAHVRADAIKQRAAEEKPIGRVRVYKTPAVDDQLSALFNADVHVGTDFVAMLTGDQGAHFGAGHVAGLDFQGFRSRLELGNQFVCRVIAHANGHGDGHAALTG